MAEPLKNSYGPEIVHGVARELSAVYDEFDTAGFTGRALHGYDELELTARAKHIAAAMADFLPGDRGVAIDIVVASLGAELENCDPDDAQPTGDPSIDDNVMSGFFYMPHGYFVAAQGGEHFEAVLRANYEITKRFTSEFSIRTPLRDHPEATLDRMRVWATDENVHVRRLVSEGTRPRLPWSFHLKQFREDPAPVIELLEMLKDDPVEYVRRSVANNLNDIAKDHPDLVIDVARRWWADGNRNRKRLIRHGLRTLIKQGNVAALDVLGYGASSPVELAAVSVTPGELAIGGKVQIEIELHNPSSNQAGALVDLRINFVKANGSTSPKVFKGGEVDIAPGATETIRKTISVAQHSTRKHYPGEQVVEVLVNGTAHPAGAFGLTAAK